MTIVEDFLSHGRFMRKIELSQRKRTKLSDLTARGTLYRHVELVEKDTAHPEGHVFDKVINDPLLGEQHLRVVKTTKPYNSDFLASAQTLTYLLPQNRNSPIITPSQGSVETWDLLLKANRICAEEMEKFYRLRGMKDFALFIGGSFSPYMEDEYIRTQAVKAAHVHTFLISHEFLNEAKPFRDRKEFTEFLSNQGVSPNEIRMDARRFFPERFQQLFNEVVTEYLMNEMQDIDTNDLGNPRKQESSVGYPTGGIVFNTKGLEFLGSRQFNQLLRGISKKLDQFYSEIFMPIFVNNYAEVANMLDPDPSRLQFNSREVALDRFNRISNTTLKIFISPEHIEECRQVVEDIANRLDPHKPPMFTFGPSFSFTAIYDSETKATRLFFVYGLFGSGTTEAIGLDKAPFPGESNEDYEKRFFSTESRTVEKEFDSVIKGRLTAELN